MTRIDRTGSAPLIPPVKKVQRIEPANLDSRRQNPHAAPSTKVQKPGRSFEAELAAVGGNGVVSRVEATHATLEELLAQQGVIMEDEDHPDA